MNKSIYVKSIEIVLKREDVKNSVSEKIEILKIYLK
jgi:hypothetical protein